MLALARDMRHERMIWTDLSIGGATRSDWVTFGVHQGTAGSLSD
jgi:hypothetical protein